MPAGRTQGPGSEEDHHSREEKRACWQRRRSNRAAFTQLQIIVLTSIHVEGRLPSLALHFLLSQEEAGVAGVKLSWKRWSSMRTAHCNFGFSLVIITLSRMFNGRLPIAFLFGKIRGAGSGEVVMDGDLRHHVSWCAGQDQKDKFGG